MKKRQDAVMEGSKDAVMEGSTVGLVTIVTEIVLSGTD